jgi:MFS transporter, OFA family, oxalate/formate antiporter
MDSFVGAAATVIPLTLMIKSSGYQQTFLVFGIVQGLVVLGAAMLLVTPVGGPAEQKAPSTLQGVRDYRPSETLRSPVFWILYVMFVLVGAGGLMAVR